MYYELSALKTFQLMHDVLKRVFFPSLALLRFYYDIYNGNVILCFENFSIKLVHVLKTSTSSIFRIIMVSLWYIRCYVICFLYDSINSFQRYNCYFHWGILRLIHDDLLCLKVFSFIYELLCQSEEVWFAFCTF